MAATVRANGGGMMRDAAFAPGDGYIVTARSDPKFSVTRNPLAIAWPKSFPQKTKPFLPGRLWEAETGRELAAIGGARVAFVGVEFRADGKRALLRGDEYPRSAGQRGFGRLARGHYSHGGPRLAEAVLWDLEQQRQVVVLDAGRDALHVATFHPGDGRILTASDSLVQVWSAEGSDPHPIDEARGRDWTSYSASGDWLLSQDADGFPAVWGTSTLEKLRRFEGLGDKVWEAWFCADDREVGILAKDGLLAVFDRQSGTLLWEGIGSGRNTGRTVASRDGHWLATVIDKHQVDLWDLKNRRLARTIERHLYSVSALSFSPNGQWLGTGDSSGAAWIWPLRLAHSDE